MKRSWWYRFLGLIFFTVIAVMAILPTFMDFKEDSNYPIKSKISLGLDLQGGLYMILGIDFKKVFKDEVVTYGRRIQGIMNDEGVKLEPGEVDDTDPQDPKLNLVLTSASDMDKVKDKIHEFFPSVLRITADEGQNVQVALSRTTRLDIEEQSVTKSIEVIRNRIDEFGVTEPEILSQGNDRIVVALPGVRDIERAKDLIGQTAKLEFKLVNDNFPFAQLQDIVEKARTEKSISFKTGDRFSTYLAALNEFAKAQLPEGTEIAFERSVSNVTNEVTNMVPYLVESNTQLTGEELSDARVLIDQQKNEPYVSLEFKTQGAKQFERITGENTGRRLAIILDGNVYSAPNIQTRIAGGRAQITLGQGNFNNTMKEARDLALVLRAGALPVQLDFEEQRTVGPSLGADSIEKAEVAGLIGAGVVFLFILIYYRISGAIAIVTLVLNVLFVIAILVGLEATLTLPGIAGIALTVGMAVDANIVIYERIRDEIKRGVSNYKAVEEGFDQAFWTIVDANITTALAGICLLNFGTGPVRGFAVTLLIGIVATVYCSYFVGKMMFELYMNKTEGQDLSI